MNSGFSRLLPFVIPYWEGLGVGYAFCLWVFWIYGEICCRVYKIVGAKNPLLGGVGVGYAPTSTGVICHEFSLSP